MTNVIQFLHVAAAAVWVGGGIMMQILMYRAQKIGPEVVGSFSQAAEWTSQRVFMPASFATLIFGVWTAVAGDYDFSKMWINVGFVGFLLSAAIGMAVLGPTAKKMKGLIEERGPNDPVVTHLARRIQAFGRLDLIILVAVVFAMVTQLNF